MSGLRFVQAPDLSGLSWIIGPDHPVLLNRLTTPGHIILLKLFTLIYQVCILIKVRLGSLFPSTGNARHRPRANGCLSSIEFFENLRRFRGVRAANRSPERSRGICVEPFWRRERSRKAGERERTGEILSESRRILVAEKPGRFKKRTAETWHCPRLALGPGWIWGPALAH